VVSVSALRDADAIIGYLLIGTDIPCAQQVEAERKQRMKIATANARLKAWLKH